MPPSRFPPSPTSGHSPIESFTNLNIGASQLVRNARGAALLSEELQPTTGGAAIFTGP
jgi:hypothetical protein